MEAIEKHTGLVYPMKRDNVDTDQIIPKQFLKRIERTGFGQFLFYHWRFDNDGHKRSDFTMNEAKYDDASILIAGRTLVAALLGSMLLGRYWIMDSGLLLLQALQIFFIIIRLKMGSCQLK